MTDETWTIQSTLEWTQGYLQRKGDENPLLSAQWLLSEVTSLSRLELYTNFERPLTQDERDVLRGYVSRRGAGEPLQYITGEVGFRHITVKVREGVLIPRPETEVLVSEALALLPHLGLDVQGPSQPLLAADLCTGSGCIACSLAYENKDIKVYATDISQKAVALARENVEALALSDRVEVLESNLGSSIPGEMLGQFDLVISNPPYIPSAVLETLPSEVGDFEPSLALDGGEDGLDLVRPLLAWTKEALKPSGICALELHEGHLDEAADLARQSGFEAIRIIYDLAEKPRVLTMRKRES